MWWYDSDGGDVNTIDCWHMCNRRYTPAVLAAVERDVLSVLDYTLGCPTALEVYGAMGECSNTAAQNAAVLMMDALTFYPSTLGAARVAQTTRALAELAVNKRPLPNEVAGDMYACTELMEKLVEVMVPPVGNVLVNECLCAKHLGAFADRRLRTFAYRHRHGWLL
jgi:hypothetical protein